jgi:predicted transcriptional regulator
MISPRQVRAGRALLGWSQWQLADKAIVSVNALARLERGEVNPRTSTLKAVEKALTNAGIVFVAAGGKSEGEGVRLASADS